jgi:hypothetical protein
MKEEADAMMAQGQCPAGRQAAETDDPVGV